MTEKHFTLNDSADYSLISTFWRKINQKRENEARILFFQTQSVFFSFHVNLTYTKSPSEPN